MLLISKDKKDLILNCNCGCDSGFHLILDQVIKNNDIYAMGCFTNGNFYVDQNSFWQTLKNKCRKIWAIIRNKDYYYSDIVCTRDDLETLNQYISDFLEENPVVNNIEDSSINSSKDLYYNINSSKDLYYNINSSKNSYYSVNGEILK